jgi:hypothetical protein
MDTSEAWKYKRDWKEYRRKPIGELLQLKFSEYPYKKTLAEMALERRAFVRDKLIDRILSVCAMSYP